MGGQDSTSKYYSAIVYVVLAITFINGAVMKPFNFHCSNIDFCTFPLQYCSSTTGCEYRCLPCSPSVCKRRTPPLQCSYNCSLLLQIDEADQVDSTTFNGWMVAALAEILAIVLLVAGVAYLCKMIKDLREVNQSNSDLEMTMSTDEEPFLAGEGSQDGDETKVDNTGQATPAAGQAGEVKSPEVVQDGSVVPYKPITNLTILPQPGD